MESFKKDFSTKSLQQESIITLVTNFNLIYLTLIGMTDLAHKNNLSSTAVVDYY